MITRTIVKSRLRQVLPGTARPILSARAFVILPLAAFLFSNELSLNAETWNVSSGGSWNSSANWNPATIPNAVGATARFNGAATASNPAQTANRSITLDGVQ